MRCAPGESSTSGMILLGLYALFVLAGELLGIGISYEYAKVFSTGSEVVFLALMLAMLVVPWPVACWVQDNFFPG